MTWGHGSNRIGYIIYIYYNNISIYHNDMYLLEYIYIYIYLFMYFQYIIYNIYIYHKPYLMIHLRESLDSMISIATELATQCVK